MDLVTQDNNTVWCKLFNCTSDKNWGNILGLIELLFCLPVSNGHVERVFSQLKVIKTNRQTCLWEDRLDSQLRIATTGPPLSDWDASLAVQLWWNDKQRRDIEDTRAPPKKKVHTDDMSNSDTESPSFILDDWEDWTL